MPYNPDIANTFFRAGEIEAWGRGIDRIITACKNDGFSTPEFLYDASGIWRHSSLNIRKEPLPNMTRTLPKRLP